MFAPYFPGGLYGPPTLPLVDKGDFFSLGVKWTEFEANKSSLYITEFNYTIISNCITFLNIFPDRVLFDKLLGLCVDKKNQLDATFVFFISLLLVAQHVSGNHVPIIRS